MEPICVPPIHSTNFRRFIFVFIFLRLCILCLAHISSVNLFPFTPSSATDWNMLWMAAKSLLLLTHALSRLIARSAGNLSHRFLGLVHTYWQFNHRSERHHYTSPNLHTPRSLLFSAPLQLVVPIRIQGLSFSTLHDCTRPPRIIS